MLRRGGGCILLKERIISGYLRANLRGRIRKKLLTAKIAEKSRKRREGKPDTDQHRFSRISFSHCFLIRADPCESVARFLPGVQPLRRMARARVWSSAALAEV